MIREEIIEKDNDITLDKIKMNMHGFPDVFDNYWNEYYLPRSLTWIRDLFAYNMNSTRRYQPLKNSSMDCSNNGKFSVGDNNRGKQAHENDDHNDNNNKYGSNKNIIDSPFISRKQSWINKRLRTLLVAEEERCKGEVTIKEQPMQKDITKDDEIKLSLYCLNKLINNEQEIKSSLFNLSHREIPILLSSSTLNGNNKRTTQTLLPSSSPADPFTDLRYQMNINDVYPFSCILPDIQDYNLYSSQSNLNTLKPLEDYSKVISAFHEVKTSDKDLQIYQNMTQTKNNDFIFID